MSRIIKGNAVQIGHEVKLEQWTKLDIQNIPLPQIPEFQEDRIARLTEEWVNSALDSTLLIPEPQHNREEILTAAQVEAERIIQEAQAEAERIRSRAHQEGYEIGFMEGFNEGSQRAASELEKEKDLLHHEYEVIMEEAYKEKQDIITSAEPEIVDMVISISRRILGESLIIKPEIIVEAIKNGIEVINASKAVIIHVSTEDYEQVMEQKEQILSISEEINDIEIHKNYSLQKGDCLIETPFGSISCGIHEQLNTLQKEFEKLIRK